MKRFNPSLASSLSTLAVLAVVGLLLSFGAIGSPGGSEGTDVATPNADIASETDNVDGDVGGETAGESGSTGNADTSAGGTTDGGARSGGTSTGGNQSLPKGVECARGKNGGSTDVGVTGSSVKLAATIVLDGAGASFLAPVRTAMNAVAKKVNADGGICGRTLNLVLRNDSWDASRGQQFIRNFVEGEKVFALAVVPSSEGLQAADSYIREHKVPVVGTDGMLIHQYRNPWIWPVATPTISTMHIMAKDAHDRGAKEFGIVFDAKYHFGVEGAYAFNQAVKRLTGSDIIGFNAGNPKEALKACNGRFCGIQPNQPSYGSEANQFNQQCGLNDGGPSRPRCDFVAMLLEPDTAVTWFAARRTANPSLYPSGGYGGAQPLFNRSLAEGCATSCHGMWVWTGYIPPIETLAQQPAVAKYVNDVRAESSSVDITNQFVQGGYVGMQLLVQALRDVGPVLTREALRKRLDAMTFDLGLSKPLSWSPGNHFANVSARAFEIQYQSSFSGFRAVRDFLVDPWVGQDVIETD